MKDALLVPLEQIDLATHTLLSATELSFQNQQIVQSIQDGTQQMIELVASIPDLTWEKAREVLSFESRSYLASIIGYAEMLLSDVEDDIEPGDQLTPEQMALVHKVRQQGKTVFNRLIRLEG